MMSTGKKVVHAFTPTIEKNNDWVYRKKPLMEFVDEYMNNLFASTHHNS